MDVKPLLYIEIPHPKTQEVLDWLQKSWQPSIGKKTLTQDGLKIELGENSELSIFLWSLQRTTYLKIYRWGKKLSSKENKIKKELKKAIYQKFPQNYPQLPDIDLTNQSIFEALKPHYPETVKYFQKMPQGEYDLNRVYWWEKKWRESVENNAENSSNYQVKPVLFKDQSKGKADYDLIYVGGALGAIHAALMAKIGYNVLVIERLKFGRMNREWNISRDEFQVLIDLGLFTKKEFEHCIAAEYKDGFSKFFDANNPEKLKANVLHTPTVLNIALDTNKLLEVCQKKLIKYGADIWDETDFEKATVGKDIVTVKGTHLVTEEEREATGRLLIDAMGTASPIAWQMAGKRTFDSVCPTVGAILEGFDPEVWDKTYGDVLFSHGDISRGRQLIWELFPAEGDELTIYLFHYHQVHPDNPGSLLEMYEDFFNILPEYRRCDMDKLVWKKPTFGYIPGRFTVGENDREIATDRVMAIGDAASLQSPLVFTGFGSLVRNLGRLTNLLDKALKNDLLDGESLNRIKAYQSNIAVTWLFSKGMMVPTHKTLPPERVNSMLNTFFGLLADEPDTAEVFIKDRTDWFTFNRLALKAARKNPALLLWIWEMAGTRDIFRWMGSYAKFTFDALKNLLFSRWFNPWLENQSKWLKKSNPKLWFKLLTFGSRFVSQK
ncbi:flavin-dependent dehydrogenase [Cyanobacterium sp. IPPAS B-1200]|uniref:flavin-dependent dehydrogenase n=1 Tax=Cyanobacterium sp. IPPAS B-1200 TaxID=1562720 RepID=UPI00085280EC|nr:flavin-dependent dehydrogenase [Cyanobacterium sp. IPPAS B-1200]OEJ79212.1 flavin-dependent dehydrogenase [Cyanobacterium sp. IPPAS B-1200]